MAYFDQYESICYRLQGDVKETLRAIADRYIGANPMHPPVFRAFRTDGFLRNAEYQYIFDLDAKYPLLRNGQFVYAWAKLWRDQAAPTRFSVNCYGPVIIYLNGGLVFQSKIMDDVFPERKNVFAAEAEAGWNHIVIRFMKTETGCGGRFGTGSIKGMPFHVAAPTAERGGQEGWIYTEPLDEPLPVASLPGADTSSEADTGLIWHPRPEWSDEERSMGRFARIFGPECGRRAYAWTKLANRNVEQREITLAGRTVGRLTVYIDGREVYESPESSSTASSPTPSPASIGVETFRITVPLSYGEHDLLVRSDCTDGDAWGFDLEPSEAGVSCMLPVPVHGARDAWLYLGTFPKGGKNPPAADICRMDALFPDGRGGTYWRLDEPYMVVRPYLENAHFGKWNYPLGVTLYGIFQTGLTLDDSEMTEYAQRHIELCTSYDEYALWDRERYGAAAINHQLSAIDSLDDCGSFAAAMLTVLEHRRLKGARAAADRVAHYISRVQDRLPDGALYRVRGSTEFMKDTMWCDDLYMSTPFLRRYYKLTGDRAYLDDAAKQFLLYKKYLYMPDRQIMSHVYDFKFGKPTGIPWGRGNGWVLFSLSEVLETLPEDHELRPELIRFFKELCCGYLRLQGANGLWHQVLTMPESYEETSCTSMFVYAFSRGIRFGWLDDKQSYADAALRAWEGMTRRAIDRNGNVYGVCRGSGYSFSPLYYKDELSWNLNDTHGIGIVLLAGIEVVRLQSFLGR
ncbi:glycoside hydrolase family 88 protein [Paenibacillus cisolokensis]|uniref:glycoside hydrolase family 88/105 protein n=1 Tax=Paenibacillus cisolokensis TaxID=1658519 RepID=UPI003D28500E